MGYSCQAPLTNGFPRHKYWSGCHFLLQEIFPTQGSKPHLLHLLHWQVGSLPLVLPGKPMTVLQNIPITSNLYHYWCFPGGSDGKESPAILEIWVRSLEDLLENGMATHSSILVWKIPWTEELGRLQAMGLQRVGRDWVTNRLTLSLLFLYHYYMLCICCVLYV